MATTKTTPTVNTNKLKDPPPVAKVSSTKKRLMVIIGWVIFLIIVGIASFTISHNNALASNRTAESALEHLGNNDHTGVYELGTEEFKKASDKNKVKSVVNEWSKVISQATEGDAELVTKQESVKDDKNLTSLLYKYEVKPGKSKINQKELYIRVVLERVGKDYKLYTFNIDVPAPKNQ